MRIHVPATDEHPVFTVDEFHAIVRAVALEGGRLIQAYTPRQINPTSVAVSLPIVARETVHAVLAELYRRHPQARVTTGTDRYRNKEEFEAGSHDQG